MAIAGLSLPVLGSSALAAASTSSALSQYLLKSNEEPGYTVGGHPQTITAPSVLVDGGAYPKKTVKSIVATLKKAGFVRAVEESTKGTGTNEGLSLVMEFSSPAGAHTGAALFLKLAKDGQSGSKAFSVAGVPGANGLTVTGSAGGSANAYWSTGSCVFGSGIYDATALSAKSVAEPVQTGIRSQAKRVGTTCP